MSLPARLEEARNDGSIVFWHRLVNDFWIFVTDRIHSECDIRIWSGNGDEKENVVKKLSEALRSDSTAVMEAEGGI